MRVTDSGNKTVRIRFSMGARNAWDSFDLRCYIRERLLAFVHGAPATQPEAKKVG